MSSTTQGIGLGVYDISTDNTSDFVDGMSKNMGKIDGAITEKVKLNGTATNVNFIQNKVVQDGLINVYNKTLQSIAVNNNASIIYGEFMITSSNQFLWFDGLNTGLASHEYATYIDKAKLKYSNSANLTSLYYLKNKKYRYKCEINTSNKTIKTTFYDGSIFLEDIFYQYESTRTLNKIEYKDTIINLISFIYNRPLTPSEIAHNFAVLNNSPSISSIETTDSDSVKTSFLLGTKTDLIETRTGHTEEERYTALLSKFGKKFTSTGEDITVENAIENQRVLSGVIKGQTVKNIANVTKGTEYPIVGKTSVKIGAQIGFEAGKQYTICFYAKINEGSDGKIIFSFDNAWSGVFVPAGGVIAKNGWNTFKVSQPSIVASKDTIVVNGINTTTNVTISDFCIVDGDVAPTSYVPFGLSSTEAVISNNGLKYSFYSNLEDKLVGKVIDLGGLEGARNTFEFKEDGSAVYTQNTLQQVFDGSDDEGWFNNAPSNLTNTMYFVSKSLGAVGSGYGAKICAISDIYKGDTPNNSQSISDAESVSCYESIRIRILKSKLTTQDTAGFKTYLQTNPVTIRYQLATPIVTVIDKSLVPAILTQATNEFKFGDAVKPSSVEITVPVDKVTDLETRLAQVEAIMNTASNLSLQANYAEDEYNNLINQL